MNSLRKFSNVGIPTFVGLGIAWITISLVRNERRIQKRKKELELILQDKLLK